ncbi:sigma-70 family RNA polymerase sigma factor [Microbacterium aoyamense]|uniref:Sigma-70 family RNA polymerase sigma factor n=1 Tax=Microbacterium aoyamense TaxID=344166 RepID=A0ABP5AV05_9MICO|nr:sigma-70 family RNA polymerase sigma factor [Microbacterium aoyamense]
MVDPVEVVERFEAARPRMRRMAVRLLGSESDADDAVQEAWFRLARTDADSIDNLDAWLTTVVSRICLDLLRAPRRTWERSWHLEAWDDEPGTAEDPLDTVALSDRVNTALLVVLETLSPVERIAFVLHDVFGQPFTEVAAVVDKSPDAVRQLTSRARRRLRGAEHPQDGRRAGRVIVDAWLAAVSSGDLTRILALLDTEVTLRADYGATIQSLQGVDDIAAQAMFAVKLAQHSRPVLIDGMSGVAAYACGRLVSVMAFVIAEDRIVHLDVLADPQRLADLGATL